MNASDPGIAAPAVPDLAALWGAEQRFDLARLSPDDRAAAERIAADLPVLDGAAYAKLGRAEGNVAPFTYRAIPAHFYQAAVAHAIAPDKTVADGREQRKDVR